MFFVFLLTNLGLSDLMLSWLLLRAGIRFNPAETK